MNFYNLKFKRCPSCSRQLQKLIPPINSGNYILFCPRGPCAFRTRVSVVDKVVLKLQYGEKHVENAV